VVSPEYDCGDVCEEAQGGSPGLLRDLQQRALRIAREKEIKGWRREKKNALVETLNPTWVDLGQQLFKRE
jgi:hypothetical protein